MNWADWKVQFAHVLARYYRFSGDIDEEGWQEEHWWDYYMEGLSPEKALEQEKMWLLGIAGLGHLK